MELRIGGHRLYISELSVQLEFLCEQYLNAASWSDEEKQVISQYNEFLKGMLDLYNKR